MPAKNVQGPVFDQLRYYLGVGESCQLSSEKPGIAVEGFPGETWLNWVGEWVMCAGRALLTWYTTSLGRSILPASARQSVGSEAKELGCVTEGRPKKIDRKYDAFREPRISDEVRLRRYRQQGSVT